MKNLKLLLVICAVAFLSGCVKFETKMAITEDGKVDLEVTYGMMKMGAVEEEVMTTTAAPAETEVTTTSVEEKNEEETEPTEVTTTGDDTTTIGADDGDPIVISTDEEEESSLGNKVDCSSLQTKLGEGWTVTEYSDDTYEGCTIKKSYASIDDISGNEEKVIELSDISNGEFADSQLFKKDGKKYSAHFTFKTADDMKDSGTDYSSMKDLFKLSYTVELPHKSISNNATKVENDGKKLIWDIEIGKDTDIEYSFTLDGSNPSGIPWLYIGIGAGALVLIIIICLVVTKGKKCECSNCNCENKEVKPAQEETQTQPVAEEVKETTEEQPTDENTNNE